MAVRGYHLGWVGRAGARGRRRESILDSIQSNGTMDNPQFKEHPTFSRVEFCCDCFGEPNEGCRISGATCSLCKGADTFETDGMFCWEQFFEASPAVFFFNDLLSCYGLSIFVVVFGQSPALPKAGSGLEFENALASGY